jgi:hypothetical protein
MRENSSAPVYVLCGGAKLQVPNPDELFQLSDGGWADVLVVPDGALTAVPMVPREHVLLKERSHPEVYEIRNGGKARIWSPQELFDRGYNWSYVEMIPNGTLTLIPDAGATAKSQGGAPAHPTAVPAPSAPSVPDAQSAANFRDFWGWEPYHIQTTAHFSRPGRIDGTTHVWTTIVCCGYIGGTIVFFLDKDNNVLGRTDLHRYGVDVGGSRNEPWSETVDPNIASKTTSMRVAHVQIDENRFWGSIGKAVADADQLINQLMPALVAIVR